jgi:hypothetical protein
MASPEVKEAYRAHHDVDLIPPPPRPASTHEEMCHAHHHVDLIPARPVRRSRRMIPDAP